MQTNLTLRLLIVPAEPQQPLTHLKVELWEYQTPKRKPISSATPDAKGKVSFPFKGKQAQTLLEDKEHKLYFKVFDGDELLVNTSSDEQVLYWTAAIGGKEMKLYLPGDENAYFVTGQLISAKQEEVAGLKVVLFDVSTKVETSLGETTAAPDGSYAIRYRIGGMPKKGKAIPDLQVKVFDPAQGDRILGISEVLRNAGKKEVLNMQVIARDLTPRKFTISGIITALRGKPLEGMRIVANAVHAENSIKLGETKTNEKGDYSIEYDETKIAQARQLDAENTEDKEGEVSLTVGVFTGNKLLGEGAPVVFKYQNEIADIKVDIRLRLPLNQQKRLKNLNIGLGKTLQTDKLEDIFLEVEGDWGMLLSRLKQEKEFDDTTIKNLEFVHELAEVTEDFEPVLATFYGDESSWSLRDIALNFNVNRIKALAKSTGVPEGIEGEDESQKIENYATKIEDNLFRKVPTAIVHRMTLDERLPIKEPSVKDGLVAFFNNKPDFDLHTTSILTVLNEEDSLKDVAEESKEKVIKHLKNIQRLTGVSPKAAVVPKLMESGLTSAYAINNIPFGSFVKSYGKVLGGEDITKSVHRNAQNVTVKNEHIYMAAKEAITGTSVRMINGGKSVEERMAVANAKAAEKGIHINFSTLFGSVDFCECEHCNSVYSPAAYLVELFQYLRNNNLDPAAFTALDILEGRTEGIEGTPLQQFFRRRPDLGHLKLTCENTNTVLPYIDLVNEVMESFVVHLRGYINDTQDPKQANITVQNVEEETTGQLLSEPRHTNYTAYYTLAQEVYPVCKLPYHQPIESIRIYLDFLGTSRYTLLDTFRMAINPEIPENATEEETIRLNRIAELNNLALERAITAEYLQLTQEEYIILTKEAYYTLEWYRLTTETNLREEAYQGIIRNKEVWEYYGIERENEMIDELKWVKPAQKTGIVGFLRRTNILYTDLIELLKTRYLNPYYPEGLDLDFLNSIWFTYRQLQQLIIGGTGFRERLAPIVRILQGQFKGQKDYSPDFIECWVYRHFERIGKMIVLESGMECECIEGEFRIVHNTYNDAPSHFGATLRKDCTIHFSAGNRAGEYIGYLDKSDGSVVLFVEGYNNINLNISWFNGINGERGVIENGKLILDNKIFTCEDAADSCDISKIRLKHLDGTDLEEREYDRIHRFIRLWCKLGWTIDELDKAFYAVGTTEMEEMGTDSIAGFDTFISPSIRDRLVVSLPNVFENSVHEEDGGPQITIVPSGGNGGSNIDEEFCRPLPLTGVSFGITPDFLEQLAAIKKIQAKTGLELAKLLTFWSNISTAGEKSLYARLFLKHNLTSIDTVFKEGTSGVYLTNIEPISSHYPVIMAAFKVKVSDLETIIKHAGIPDTLTLDSISLIYRYILLAKSIGVKIEKLPLVIDLIQSVATPFGNARDTLHFYETYQKIEDAGFKPEQLNYVLRGIDDPTRPLKPSQGALLSLAIQLRDALLQIEKDHADIVDDEEAMEEFIRTKLGLLYEEKTIEGIIQLLNGTTVYVDITRRNFTKNLAQGTQLNNAFANWKRTEEETPGTVFQTFLERVKYGIESGIQVSGILSPGDQIRLQDLQNLVTDAIENPQFIIAVNKILNSPIRFFEDTLSPIFQFNHIEPVDAQAELLKPDSINLENPAESTDFQKRAYFIKAFLPFLREQLRQKMVVQLLAGTLKIDQDVTRKLVMEIIRTTVGEPLYDEIIRLKAQNDTDVASVEWNGFFVPPKDGKYIFLVEAEGENVELKLNNRRLWNRIDDTHTEFLRQDEEFIRFYQSAAQSLKAGFAYPISISGHDTDENGNILGLFWKFDDKPQEAIPTNALFPKLRTEAFSESYIKLYKASIIITGFKLALEEINHLQAHQGAFDNIDFNALTLPHWLRLEAYTRLRDNLPTTELNLIEFFDWTYLPPEPIPNPLPSDYVSPPTLAEQISKLTTWKMEDVENMIRSEHFDLDDVAYFHNETNLLKLKETILVADKIAVGMDLLFNWARPTSDFVVTRTIANSIREAIKARYTQEDWEQAIKPTHDKLRENQKQALIAFLLAQKVLIDWGVVDADSLFEFFFIDVQMDACMETSRIKQAISSVQLYIQRCFLGLEAPHVESDVLDRERWEWMSRYRVWEANRKVFLYPENWIEPELRDVKSPFFQELESELLQNDISDENVKNALKSYLYKVDEVANLEVVGLYLEGRLSDGKLHVFGRTRNAPFFFFYRYCEFSNPNEEVERRWYPWKKMEVDITSYEVENNNSSSKNGCYLIPVVWNNRLLIFFPNFMKKTDSFNYGHEETIENSANKTQSDLKPLEYWEIKMSCSEYKNGKWTQKQMTQDKMFAYENNVQVAIAISFEGNIKFCSNIENFIFFPIVTESEIKISIHYNGRILQRDVSYFVETGEFKGKNKSISKEYIRFSEYFKFTGNSLYSEQYHSYVDEFNDVLTFHRNEQAKIYSLQTESDASPTLYGKKPYFEINQDLIKINLKNQSDSGENDFYLARIGDLLGTISSEELSEIFTSPLGLTKDNYGSEDGNNFHELKRPFAIYIWEFYFHSVAFIADRLNNSNLFEEAMKWWHYIFNPIAVTTNVNDTWQFLPFRATDATYDIEKVMLLLKPNQADLEINEWREHPFMPHVIARSRPTAYMKWVVMKYIDNIIGWGDYLFRQDTIESINQATQMYILSSHILGPRPERIPKRGKVSPKSYMDLVDKWNAFGNALEDMEIISPNSSPVEPSDGENHYVNIFGFGTTLYFCIPNNPKLLGYWDTVADRLYKIRHCLNIEGVFRKLSLFEPPIDPGLLVLAAAQGLSIGSVLNDLSTPMPNYRFNYLLQKAMEITSELKSLGNALLSAFEKRDNETISLLRAKHENSMNNLVMEVRKKQVEEAEKSLESLQENRKAPEYRLKHYQQLAGEEVEVPGEDAEFSEISNQMPELVEESGLKLIPFEKEEMDKAKLSADLQIAVSSVEIIASFLHYIPSFEVSLKPLGIGGSITVSGDDFANAAQAIARGLQIGVNHASFQSTSAARKGGYLRQLQDRIFQANAAGFELKQIDKQITSQRIRIEIANQELANQQKQIDNSLEMEDFLRNKYSNEYLYQWMIEQIKTTYYQTYSLAYDLAKKAEKVYRFEKGIDSSNFIQFGYWNSARDGLLSGEKLYLSLKQLENAYIETKGYDYEVTKHVSLLQLNPLALIALKETGTCEFDLPEVLFDLDYPGHYKRRIKTVAVTIPCVVGPYVSLNCTLRLLQHEYRNSKISADYPKKAEEADERFVTNVIPVTAIAVSQGQNDSGVFELNFNSERYMPFEGAGAISRWRLELPKDFRQFDYNSISDMILHLRYTSCEGGDLLKGVAVESLTEYVRSNEELGRTEGLFRMFSLRHEYPNEWHRYLNPIEGDVPVIRLGNLRDRLPFFTKHTAINRIEMTDAYLLLKTGSAVVATAELLYSNLNENNIEQGDSNEFGPGNSIGGLQQLSAEVGENIFNNNTVRQWAIRLENGADVFLTNEQLSDAWLVVKYTINV